MQINYGRNTSKVYPDGSFRVISHEHALIHEGKLFVANDYVTLATAGDKRIIYFPATSGEDAHLQFEIEANKSFSYWFTEAAEVTANGTQLTFFNAHRDETTETIGSSAFHTPDGVTSGSTVLRVGYVGASNPVVKLGGATETRVYEYILDPLKTYMLQVVAGDNATSVSILVDIYEEDVDPADLFKVL